MVSKKIKVSIVPERGDALIATAARASFNRRADQYTSEQNESLQRYLVCDLRHSTLRRSTMSEYDKELIEYVMMFGRLDYRAAIKWLEENTQWRLKSED